MTERLRHTLVALRLVMLTLGFFLGMAWTAWVFEHVFGLYFSLFCAAIVAWARQLIELDVKDLTDA